jgi:dTDP-L-rhamnose 4-epimerase
LSGNEQPKGDPLAKILVTGGAGFIGRHLIPRLLETGASVRVLDCMVPQVHNGQPPQLPKNVEFIEGHAGDASLLDRALAGVDVVYHLAAEVGVGQSMYEMTRYVDHNTRETATFLEALVARRDAIRRLVVASSMSIYGEGAYVNAKGESVSPPTRSDEQMARHDWELHDPATGEPLKPVGATEAKPLDPTSVYAVTKQDQEQLCLVVGRAYAIPTVALRFFNVYGSGQALSNPYTGAAAIFASRLLNDQPPVIFEDGLQSRDLIHVSDIVQGLVLAMDAPNAPGHAINLGTGRATSIRELAEMLAAGLGRSIAPEIVNKYRSGDIRHCYSDITRARKLLGYEPKVTLEQGIPELLEWAGQQKAEDRVNQATEQLAQRGLVK